MAPTNFNAAYARPCTAGESEDSRPKIERPGNGTLAALIASYKQDAAFRDLRDTTKAGYLSRLDTIQREHGARSVSGSIKSASKPCWPPMMTGPRRSSTR